MSDKFNIINSKDVREYLESIDYSFAPVENAYLIWQCRTMPIEKRHEAFAILLEGSESCLVKTHYCPDGWDLHKTISNFVSMENKLIKRLIQPEDNCFYISEYYECGHYWHGEQCRYSCYENAFKDAKKYVEEMNVGKFRIQKCFIDNSETRSSVIEAVFNDDCEMMEIDIDGDICGSLTDYEQELLFERFDCLWFDIPIPFKPGDIVCDCFERVPFVLTETVPWFLRSNPPKRQKSTTHLTDCDMTASGYSVNKNTLSATFDWLAYKYLNLEYYTENLTGFNRILSAYSQFRKGAINGDTLVKLSQLYTFEMLARKMHAAIDWDLDDETRKQLEISKFKEQLVYE